MEKIRVKKGDEVSLHNGIEGIILEIDKHDYTFRSDTMWVGEWLHLMNIKTVNGIKTEYNDLDFE